MTNIRRHSINALLTVAFIGLTACGSFDDLQFVEGPGSHTPDKKTDAAQTQFLLPSYSVTFQIDGVEYPNIEVVEPDMAVSGTIGRGTLIDMLRFAVYDDEGHLLPQYAREEYAEVVIDGKTFTASEGQNIILWNGESRTIEITGLSAGDYKIVCWAQSSKCDAYDTSDLKQVKVSYDGALNNDETRDAFCASEPFSISAEGDNPGFTAILRRPLAQVNIATTGADYANTGNIIGGALYTYSAVTIKGVANTINVVDNVIGNAIDKAVTFGFNKLPAYFGIDIPTKKEDLITTPGEQWLQIHLNEDTINDNDGDGFADFKQTYPTVEYTEDDTDIKLYLTETFKYMSMCYVLIPSNNGGAAILNNFKATFADNAAGDTRKTSLTLTMVPTRRNWRTNILGGFYDPGTSGDDKPNIPPNTPDEDDPNIPGGDEPNDPPQPPVVDPEEPNDPTTIFPKGVTCNVRIISTYFNNNNELR